MHKEDHRVGVTPIIMRRAGYYAARGIGEYTLDHPHYDKVTVTQLYPITPSPTDIFEWAFGLRVTFYRAGIVQRWVEFSSRTSGVGGRPLMRSVGNE